MRLNISAAASIVCTLGFVGCVGSDHPSESMVDQSVLTVCSGFATKDIDPQKEIIIRDLSVVEDPCRSTFTPVNPASCPAGSIGKWTFGRLMASMSGTTDVNSVQARNFVAKWLSNWWTDRTIGTDLVKARGNIDLAMLNPWLTASGCAVNTDPGLCTTLDLTSAPFRLLAIVNRVDMDGRDYVGNGAPGELRFVFGGFNKASVTPPEAFVNAAAIFEYRYPAFPNPAFPSSPTIPPIPPFMPSAFTWATVFHTLSGLSYGPAFASQLQLITDRVVEINANPGGPNNGSAISQVRTNENAFDTKIGTSRQWEFRQFSLACTTGTCLLAQVPVSQTPPTTLNNTAALTNFMITNQTAISTSRHVVPTNLLGGSSLSLPGNVAGANAVLWNTTVDTADPNLLLHVLVKPTDAAFSYTVRHNFAFSTCNGCHYLETANTLSQFHIKPRQKGFVAGISGFASKSLLTSDGINSQDPLYVDDPNPDGIDPINGTPLMQFTYNEIWRRSCEIRRILAGSGTPFTTTTGHN
jgi:hypothetical protein